MNPSANVETDIQTMRTGYVVKRYPRFSETFIVNEVLAHEAVGTAIEIFALRPPVDTHFQNVISQVRAPVTYLPASSVKSTELWKTCHALGETFPKLWLALAEARHASVVDAYQAIHLAIQIRDRQIEHLHAHFASSAATVAQLAARIAGISFSVTMHAKDIFHESVNEDDLASKIADSRFVVTVSDFNRDYLVNNFGFPDKIHRVYNGLDLNVFDFNSSFERPRKIISVGRLVYKKGLCHLVDACRILADKEVEFSCEIIGTGELESELRQQIEKLSLTQQVELTGPQPQNIVREKIVSSAVFAAPCVVGPDGNRDGLPTVITESAALGTPCVATDVTGIPEIIRHNETGFIVPQGDAVELAGRLEQLLASGEQRQSFANRARMFVEREFDIHKNVAHIRDLLFQPKQSHSLNSKQLQGV